MSQRSLTRTSRGLALIEALVALLIVALAVVAMGGVQATLVRSADLARQRGDALRLAQQDLERLRGFISLNGKAHSFAAIGNASSLIPALERGFNADYVLNREVQAAAGGQAAAVRVTVSWQDRAGARQQVRLDSLIHRADPALSFALSLPPAQERLGASSRHAGIPPAALDLGDGRSAYLPAGGERVAWIFDNVTGTVISRCRSGPGPAIPALADLDLISCVNVANGYLLSGTVRFSAGTLPLSLDLILSSNRHLIEPAFECTSLTLTAQARVDYDCIVHGNSDAPPIWSGYLDLAGLPFQGPKAVKVCRYSADYDGDGRIGNAEHPEHYLAVSRALRNQNFLVVPAAEDCPAGHGIDPDRGWFTNTATVLHQDEQRPSHRPD